MITAKEANQKSRIVQEQKDQEMKIILDKCIPTIESAINKAADSGKMTCDLDYDSFNSIMYAEAIQALCKMLKESGYVVWTCPIQETITISWDINQIYTKKL
jgi:hypothetical protein